MWSLSAYWGLLSRPAFFIWDSWQEGAHKSSVKLNRSRGVQFWLLMFPLVSRRICSQNLPAVDILRESESIARVPCHKRVPVFLLKAHVSLKIHVQFQFSCSLCLTLQPHGLQHARPPCLSPTSGVYPNSCPLSRWCHPTISSSVVPCSSRPQSFLKSGSFQMSQLFHQVVKVLEFQLQYQSF